ncbi:MAG: hypothetical protein H0W99_05845 [Acidobacteria bacterium]|nr:hypothetical protein [Acidobacteriota bacterium]
MRTSSQFCCTCVAISVLMLALTGSTFAGEIPYPGVTTSSAPTTSGEIQFSEATADPVTEIVLSLLQSALSLF